MKHYDFVAQFQALYDHAVTQYARGVREAAKLYSPSQATHLTANGLTAQNMFDYAEDHAGAGEPGFGNALAIELIRRDYFLNVQHGHASRTVLDESKMPAKTDAIRGIEWLPRIIPKAKAKLRGELPPSLMYCCGGDRRFFKAHDILPSEFLAVVWRHEHDDAAIVDWVVKRSGGK